MKAFANVSKKEERVYTHFDVYEPLAQPSSEARVLSYVMTLMNLFDNFRRQEGEELLAELLSRKGSANRADRPRPTSPRERTNRTVRNTTKRMLLVTVRIAFVVER